MGSRAYFATDHLWLSKQLRCVKHHFANVCGLKRSGVECAIGFAQTSELFFKLGSDRFEAIDEARRKKHHSVDVRIGFRML